MKRKLISFFMALCIVFSAVPLLSGCESGMGVDQIAFRRAFTLVIYYIVGDSTTPEAIAEVQRALNEITESRFTTRIELVGLRAQDYEEAINRAFAAYDEVLAERARLEEIRRSEERLSRELARSERDAGITTARPPRTTIPPETELPRTERIVWPEPAEDQIDIFLINSEEMFLRLVGERRLAQIDEYLNTRARILREYIHPSILIAGQHDGRSFAIPTNRAVGEATWIAVNSRLAEQHEIDFIRTEFGFSEARGWRAVTDWLEPVRAAEPGIAMFEGSQLYPTAFEPLFPQFPHFAIQATAGRTPVFTPERMPDPPPPPAPTEPPTDAAGNLIPVETTIPPTTLPPRPIPARTVTAPDPVIPVNQFTLGAWRDFAELNQRWREGGLFEAGPVADNRERAVFTITGTLEDMLAQQAIDAANGFEFEYIMIRRPLADREFLRSAMFAVSVSSPNTQRAMEIVTLLNTNRQFKNIFTYGVEGTHWIWNDYRQIERLNNDYMVDMSHTGNHFIADLLAGENPDRWELAKQHNLTMASSVFLRGFPLDTERLPAEINLNAINAFGLGVRQTFLNGLPPGSEFETFEDYIRDYVTPGFEELGATELLASIRDQLPTP